MKYIKYLILVFIMLPFNVSALEFASNAKSAILLEPTTGEIIFEKNVHDRYAPASMTKMMSMLLIIENIEKGAIKWDDIVTVSSNASGMGGSQILLETNEKMSVKDLFKGIGIASGNDAVVAMAEYIAGTEANFVTLMNEKAKELNLKNTNFKNSHGLDAANHYSSAYDMAMIAKELVKYDEVLEITKIYDTYLRENLSTKIWLVNTNKLVKFYDGVDGLKTGYTSSAGYCLTATAKKDDTRVIAVVMGEPDSKTRNKEVSEMFDYVFAQYRVDVILDENSVIETIELDRAKIEKVNIVPLTKVTRFRKKIDEIKESNYKLELDEFKLPIKKGDVVGRLIIDNNRTVLVTVSEDIDKANIFELFMRYLNDVISFKL